MLKTAPCRAREIIWTTAVDQPQQLQRIDGLDEIHGTHHQFCLVFLKMADKVNRGQKRSHKNHEER